MKYVWDSTERGVASRVYGCDLCTFSYPAMGYGGAMMLKMVCFIISYIISLSTHHSILSSGPQAGKDMGGGGGGGLEKQ